MWQTGASGLLISTSDMYCIRGCWSTQTYRAGLRSPDGSQFCDRSLTGPSTQTYRGHLRSPAVDALKGRGYLKTFQGQLVLPEQPVPSLLADVRPHLSDPPRRRCPRPLRLIPPCPGVAAATILPTRAHVRTGRPQTWRSSPPLIRGPWRRLPWQAASGRDAYGLGR